VFTYFICSSLLTSEFLNMGSNATFFFCLSHVLVAEDDNKITWHVYTFEAYMTCQLFVRNREPNDGVLQVAHCV
jgi:hypothetical protein